MKKLFLLAGMLAVATSFAGPDKKVIKCAVMKDDDVTIATATKAKMFSDYKGKRYFFCCPACKPQFDKDPAKFAKTAPSIPAPKSKKG